MSADASTGASTAFATTAAAVTAAPSATPSSQPPGETSSSTGEANAPDGVNSSPVTGQEPKLSMNTESTLPATNDLAAPETTTKTADAPPAAENGASGEGSAKKTQKRKSGGVPEHKNKKLQKKKSLPAMNLDAQPGDFYMVRMKGYPAWPSVICDEEMLPENLLLSRPVTAKRPDGTYRDDYQKGGKNDRDRTFPVMFLHTNEFAWVPNTDLTPIDFDNFDEGPPKKSKALTAAYEVVKRQDSLDHFKGLLAEHARVVEEAVKAEEEKLALKAEKAAEKAEKKTSKKSKAKVDADGDVKMEDGAEGGSAKKPKSSKKRKAEGDPENKKTKSTKTNDKLKINLSQNGDSSSKGKSAGKSKEKAAKPAKPKETAAERLEKLKQTIFFFRHKLQKGFISRETPPTEEEMPQLHDYMSRLEQQENLEDNIIKSTKIHKVLKAIAKLPQEIPGDDKFSFKERSKKLLSKWNRPLGDDEKGDDDALEAKKGTTEEPASEKKEASEKPEESTKEEETKPMEDVKPQVETAAEDTTTINGDVVPDAPSEVAKTEVAVET